jgi:uroporphyrinogen-III synthase
MWDTMDAAKPLAGRCVIVTRPSAQAQMLAEPLRALGAEAFVISALEILPAIDAAPLRDAVTHLENYDWLVVTSVNGVSAIEREARAQDKSLDTRKLQIAAIGEVTAAAMTAAGGPARILPDNFTATQLAERLAHHMPGRRVLLVQGTGANNSLGEALAAKGAHVERVDAYRNAVPAALAKELGLFLLSGKRADAVTFTSSQMALNFFRALEAKEQSLSEETVIASIGPVTSATLRELGHAPDVEARPSTMAALADALGDFFRDRR